MRILCFCLVLTMALPSMAQMNKQQMLYAQKAAKYGRMKTTGAVLTLAGGALFVLGIAIISNSTVKANYNNGATTYTTTSGNPDLGIASTLLGIGGLGSGIPLLIIGTKKQRQYQNKIESLSAGLRVTPHSTGLRLIYRF